MIWTRKPPYGTQINRSHPWVGPSGMQGFYALNEGAGSNAYDSMGNLNLAATGFGSTNPWGVASQGGLNCNAVGKGVQRVLPASLQFGWPITVATAFRYLGSATSGCFTFGITYATASTSPFYVIMISLASSAALVNYNTSGSFIGLASSTTLSAGNDYIVAATATPTLLSLYVNGSLVKSAAISGNPTYGTSPLLVIGEWSSIASRNSASVFYWSSWWNTALPASVHAAIGSNVNAIWQIFQPAGVPVYKRPSGILTRRTLFDRVGSRGAA